MVFKGAESRSNNMNFLTIAKRQIFLKSYLKILKLLFVQELREHQLIDILIVIIYLIKMEQQMRQFFHLLDRLMMWWLYYLVITNLIF